MNETTIRKWLPIDVPGLRDCAAYKAGPLRAFVALEGGRWHLSISCASGRYPTWDEIADARYDLLPDGIDAAIILPPRADYVNIANVFHVWEIRDRDRPDTRAVGHPRTYESGIVPEARRRTLSHG